MNYKFVTVQAFVYGAIAIDVSIGKKVSITVKSENSYAFVVSYTNQFDENSISLIAIQSISKFPSILNL